MLGMKSEGDSQLPDLEGKTLKVYWLLLNEGKLGPRDVQRRFGFPSVNSALYHLDKLLDLGLVDKDVEGKYFVVKKMNVGILRLFVGIGRFHFPRMLFYSILMVSLISSYLILSPASMTRDFIFMLIIAVISVAIFAYETFHVWRQQPF